MTDRKRGEFNACGLNMYLECGRGARERKRDRETSSSPVSRDSLARTCN